MMILSETKSVKLYCYKVSIYSCLSRRYSLENLQIKIDNTKNTEIIVFDIKIKSIFVAWISP